MSNKATGLPDEKGKANDVGEKDFFITNFFLCSMRGPILLLKPAMRLLPTVWIQEIFSNPKSYKRYRGQKGYLLFMEVKNPNISDMGYVFQKASKALGEDFKILGWQKFRGSVAEFKSLSDLILDERGRIKAEYKGMAGYARFAEDHYGGDMLKAFVNASSVLSKKDFKSLGWQAFHGLVKEFHEVRKLLLDEKAEIKAEYKGMAGYARFSEEHYDGDMLKAFLNASSVLSKKDFKRSGWQAFIGSVKEFYEVRKLLLDEKGRIKAEYKGMEGYARFAEDHYAGDMKRAFQNASSVLGKAVLKSLGWQKFHGSVEEFKSLSDLILDEKGEIKAEYKGMAGYARFAEKYYAGDMLKAFINASSVLSKAVFKSLGWQGFKGSVEEFKSLSAT